MKKLILFLLLIPSLLFAQQQEARMNLGIVGGSVVAAGGPDCTCAGGSWEGGAVERFESGVGAWCTIPKTGEVWSSFNDTNGVVNLYNTTTGDDDCGHVGSFADTDGTAAVRAMMEFTSPTADSNFAIQFSFKVSDFTTGGAWGNNEYITIAQFGSSGRVDVIYWTSQSGVVIRGYLGSTLIECLVGEGAPNIDANTWYTIVFDYNQNADSAIYIYSGIDTSNLLYHEHATASDDPLNAYRFGIQTNGSPVAWTGTIYMDNIKFIAAGL